MSLTDLLAALPADALLPVSWVRAQLDADSAPVPAPLTASVDATAEQIAERMGKKPSTVRTWLARGELPGAYKLHGEWRIPATALAAMQQTHAAKHAQTAQQPRTATNAKPADIGAWRQHLPSQRAS